jgi:cytochrome c551/c552
MAKEKCSSCHTATTTKKAPSFASVAQKYKGDAGAEAKLVACSRPAARTTTRRSPRATPT